MYEVGTYLVCVRTYLYWSEFTNVVCVNYSVGAIEATGNSHHNGKDHCMVGLQS